MITVSSDFECGSIRVLEINSPEDIRLELAKDNSASTRQWFYFLVTAPSNISLTITIHNAGCSSFNRGWTDYRAFASNDQQHWFRVDTRYRDGQLTIMHSSGNGSVYFAYFPPYTAQRQKELLKQLSSKRFIDLCSIGRTAYGNSLDLIKVGTSVPDGQKIWMIARQHPGETMAQWFAEGFIKELLQPEIFTWLHSKNMTFYCIANMNPDGSMLGNHRTNAEGVNLNREWYIRPAGKSLEVQSVMQLMGESGADLFLDVHGEEEIPYNFAMSVGRNTLGEAFKEELQRRNHKFQTKFDYDSYQTGCRSACCKGMRNGSLGTKAIDFVSQYFHCPSILIEMAFKELKIDYGEVIDWNEKDCMKLGADSVHSILTSIK